MIVSSELYAIAPMHGYTRQPAENRRVATGEYVAVVQIVDELTKAKMVTLRGEINRLAASPSIGAICLLIDSPGGSVAGTADLAMAVARATKAKPVHAFIEDLGASAAYWIASQATSIACNVTAHVGSIGVYRVVVSEARLLERIGVDVYIVRSGAHKGATVEGAKITAEQLAELQQRVDAIARLFIADVARGRRLGVGRVAEIADGRVFVGAAAKAAGLVDRVCLFEDLLGELETQAMPQRYAQMAGREAWETFNALARAEEKLDGTSEGVGVYAIRRRHPELSVAAEAWLKEQRNKGDSRWSHLPISERSH